MTDTDSGPTLPRPAATVLVLRDDPFEVLMVRRHAKAVFASALVFPGGAIDPDDASEDWLPLIAGAGTLSAEERAIRIAAIRETYEETSLLLATDSGETPAATPGTPLRELVERSGLVLDLGALVPFGHWITPEAEPRRFDTHFLLAAAPAGQEAVSDGGETVGFEWARPDELIGRSAAGERSIMFPTLMNLTRLAESTSTAGALAAARARAPFAVYARVESREDGTRAIVIPSEAGYGVTEFPVG